MNKFVKVYKTICILINQQREVYYSNISKNLAWKHLKDFHIFSHLPVYKTVFYNVGHYKVSIDKVDLDKREYYLILIQPWEKLYRHIYKDLLTGLYNRNYWEHLVSDMQYRRLSKKFTLVIIDVDNLKQLNDNKGHLIGDRAIRIVGQAIKEGIRKSDIGVRYGGDEFFILLANTKKNVAEKVINRIRKNINRKGKKENINIEISAGIACHDCIKGMGDIIKMADMDLYREKQKKKGQRNQHNKYDDLIKEIEKIRDKLNQNINKKDKILTNSEILELSQKLDELIVKYLEKE